MDYLDKTVMVPVGASVIAELILLLERITRIANTSGHMARHEKIRIHKTVAEIQKTLTGLLQVRLL